MGSQQMPLLAPDIPPHEAWELPGPPFCPPWSRDEGGAHPPCVFLCPLGLAIVTSFSDSLTFRNLPRELGTGFHVTSAPKLWGTKPSTLVPCGPLPGACSRWPGSIYVTRPRASSKRPASLGVSLVWGHSLGASAQLCWGGGQRLLAHALL